MRKFDLGGKWRMTGGGYAVEGKIPGSVYSFLHLDNAILPDPHVGDNEDAYIALMEHDFTFERTFPGVMGKNITLVFEGEYDEIVLCDLGVYPEADMLLKHYTHTAYHSIPDLAARVLNTDLLLSAHDYPQKAGAFTVRVSDTMPSVAGTFRVRYGGGKAEVEKLADDAAVDVILPQTALAQLLYGYLPLDARSLACLDGVQVTGDCEDLLRAFPCKPGGIFEHF